MARCECCGQPLPPKGLPKGVKLTSTQQRIWEGVTNWPGMSSRELMHWSHGYNENLLDDNTIRVQVLYLNRKLRPHGLEITAGGRGSSDGYRVREL
jgi:DNA-binding response OmpR family regulator